MKKIVTVFVILFFAAGTLTVSAAQGRKGASDKALEKASDEAVFNRVGDWFAARGKTGDEKKAIIAERKAKRAADRAEKELREQKKLLEKETKKTRKKMKKQMKKTKKGFGIK